MTPVYYTLLICDDMHSPWEEHFGDWDRETVYDERLDLIEGNDFFGGGGLQIKIVQSSGYPSEIAELVTYHNLIKGLQT